MDDQQQDAHAHEGARSAYYGLSNAGRTPSQLLPPIHVAQESSLRSTLPDPDYELDSADTVIDSPPPEHAGFGTPCHPSDDIADAGSEEETTPSFITSFTPINKPPRVCTTTATEASAPRILPTDSRSFTERYKRQIPAFRLDFIELEETQLEDLNRADDRVYHFNHAEGGAYSGTFRKSSPVADEYKVLIEKSLGRQSHALRREDGARQERYIRYLLQLGCFMLLEKTALDASHGLQLECSLRGCLSNSSRIPPATYYVAFQSNGAVQFDHSQQPRYCLECLEWIWDELHVEEGTDTPLKRLTPDPLSLTNPGPIEPISYFSEVPEPFKQEEDGPMSDNEDFPNLKATTPNNIPSSESPSPTEPSPKTLPKHGPLYNPQSERSHPPTPTQHLAPFINPGNSISSKEEVKAAIWLWKAASQEQLTRNLDLRQNHQPQSFSAEYALDTSREDYTIEGTDDDEEDIEEWEQLCLMRKSDCYGNNLSEVLRASKDRRREMDGMALIG